MRERGKRKAEMDIRNERRKRYKTIDMYTIIKGVLLGVGWNGWGFRTLIVLGQLNWVNMNLKMKGKTQ
jgi:hypothetical protein